MDNTRQLGIEKQDSGEAATNAFYTFAKDVERSFGFNEKDGKPTIFPGIIFKDGEYVPTGIDPYFDGLMHGRIKWMNDTNGGKNIPPDDHSIYASEAFLCGLPPQHVSDSNSNNDSVFNLKSSQFAWLGEPANMEHTGVGDRHRCGACSLLLSKFLPGDTLLNQHAFYSRGECPYLKANYTPDRLKIAIGQERFRRGFIAHPNIIIAPDAWKLPEMKLTNRIYVTLATQEWCYLCGRSAGNHVQNCYQKMTELIHSLNNGLLELKL